MTIRQAVILAGGKGTRLGSIVRDTPKPFLEVGGAPFILVLLNRLKQCGVGRVIVSLGHLSEAALSILGTLNVPGVDITPVVEDTPLGTGGGLRHCRESLDEAFYVMNGDSFFDFDAARLAAPLAHSEVLGALALRRVDDTARYGSVCLTGDRITAFAEKTASSGAGTINAGIYALKKKALDLLPEGEASLERDLFPKLAETGRLAGIPADGFFMDIGIPEDFNRAQSLFLDGQLLK